MCDLNQNFETILHNIQNDNGKRKKKLCKGIAKYLKIQSLYCDNKIDDDFLNLFYSFYGLWRQKQNINRAGLRNYLQTARNKKKKAVPDHKEYARLLEDTITAISPNSRQFSYSTKTLHTIWNDLPIYDSRIAGFTGFKSKTAATCNFLRDAYNNREDYKSLVGEYNNLISSAACRELIKYKNESFSLDQALAVSDVKKIDFMIWVFGNN